MCKGVWEVDGYGIQLHNFNWVFNDILEAIKVLFENEDWLFEELMCSSV